MTENNKLKYQPLERLTEHTNRFQWTKQLIRLLGTTTDKAIAHMAGIHEQSVTHERQRRKVEAYATRRKKIEWTKDMVVLLGTDSDRNIATQLEIHHGSVFRKRRILGIPAFQPPTSIDTKGFLWTKKSIALLGKASDREVAKTFGISSASVQSKRSFAGISPFKPANKKIQWTTEMLGLLGKISDAKFTRKYHMTKDTVKRKRDRLNIPAYSDQAKPIARTPQIATLLKQPNKEIVKKTGISKNTIRKLRKEYGVTIPIKHNPKWSPKIIARLGKESDAKIAKDIKLTSCAVSYMRRSLNIKPCSNIRKWHNKEINLLGTAPDKEISQKINRSLDAVTNKRKSLNISSYSEKILGN